MGTAGEPKHPAKFSDAVLITINKVLREAFADFHYICVLDPFAGVGKIHELGHGQVWGWGFPRIETVGVEIEPEWARQHPNNIVGDALHLPERWTGDFDAVVTSPTYGNRMADHHDAQDGSRRVNYRQYLGRPLHENNSGRMQWGDKYKGFHEIAWREVWRVLKPGGLFVLNVSDHIRNFERQEVVRWHLECCCAIGFVVERTIPVRTPRLRAGENYDARAPYEIVVSMRKASA